MALRTNISAPSPVIRSIYLLAFFIPILTKYSSLYLPCLLTFVTISTNNYGYGLLPYSNEFYTFVTILCLIAYYLIYNLSKENLINISPLWYIIIIYILVINLFDSGNPQDISFSIITISLAMMVMGNNKSQNCFYMLNCFVLISFVLSSIYLFNFERFLQAYNSVDDIERSGWTDPNYISCIIGMGVMTSLIQLLKKKDSNIFLKILWVITILISIISMLLLASRGGLLCVTVSTIFLVLFVDIKLKFKVLVITLISLLLYALYNNGFFELIMYRMEREMMHSSRFEIWRIKIQHFHEESNVFNFFLGHGYDSAFKLGFGGKGYGFHNDFLAILCGYGIVGLISFCYLLFIYPLRKIQSSIFVVISMICYLSIACMTLEPLSSGRLVYMGFYALILIYAQIKE